MNTVVPREDLDTATDELVEKLLDKFPEKTRYTRQQLNFWRDLSWALTIGHGRDWLAIHNTSPETREGVQAFLEKRPPDYASLRERWAEDRAPEWIDGLRPSEERPIPSEVRARPRPKRPVTKAAQRPTRKPEASRKPGPKSKLKSKLASKPKPSGKPRAESRGKRRGSR